MFQRGSRYERVEDAEITDERGRTRRHKRIRITPETTARILHTLSDGERLDHVAYRHYRDPERFWRICDANLALWPRDLTAEAGKILRIPSSED